MSEEKLERTFTGRLKTILSLYQKGTFRKLEFIVVSDEQYPQPIRFELQNDKCDLLGGFLCGDEVVLDFNLRGREWINPRGETIYFNSFVVWRIKKISNGYIVPTKDGGSIQHNFNFPPAKDVFDDYDADDLPF